MTRSFHPSDDAEQPETIPGSSAGTPADPPNKQSVLRGHGGVLAALAALLVVGGTVVALSGEAREQVSLSFVRQPAKYTELYFSGDGPRQASYGSDWVVVNVPFTVVNHEGQMTSFPYVVQAVDTAETPVGRVGGTADLPEGTSLTITATVAIPVAEPWEAVDVELVGRSERLRFLASQMIPAGG